MSKLFETKLRGRRFNYWSRPKQDGTRIDWNGPPTYAWVAEGGMEHPHIYWCLHVRPGREDSFLALLRRCAEAVPELAAVPFEELFLVREVYDYNRYKLYLCKGIDLLYGKAWKVRVLADQGPVVGKRCGVSANLTRAARKAQDP